ncbi:amino acid permease [Halotalea alkalilenta]|uniref:GABA permease n=1 Tax=Halotalea alkalilenta TaxID=376489 RepID=A0A172YD35_9GAMM|nr:amino acid permease [Halotalea alkalilenta]ANF57012.1 GABA permease [Halotalea alkalilenta]
MSSTVRPTELQGQLKTRQVTMISIAGIIGAGLFIGSAKAIATAGPAVLISYAFTGLLVLLVMRMLGEMAVAQPDSGSFSTYADRAIGKWAGFTIGWLYWWFWVLVIPVEAIAGGAIINSWLPSLPVWLVSLAIVVVLTLTNLLSVKGFGEFEFWFALVKVVAIIAFIALGLAAVFGLLPVPEVGGVERLVSNGGFAPNGMGAIVGGVLITAFSFFGAEIVTIAAAESRDPQRQITRATNLVVWRIAIFYLLSIFLVVSLVDWNDPRLVEVGTFQRALEVLEIPAAKLIVDLVVLVAVTSCMNSGLYTASRMLFSLGRRGDAPSAVTRLSLQGVPRVAVLTSTLIGILACLANFLFPGQVFDTLLATTGAVALLVYLVISVSQIRLRRTLEAKGERPELRMWLFPGLSYLTVAALVLVLGYMAWAPAFRAEAVMTAAVGALVLAAGLINSGRRERLERASNSHRVGVENR